MIRYKFYKEKSKKFLKLYKKILQKEDTPEEKDYYAKPVSLESYNNNQNEINKNTDSTKVSDILVDQSLEHYNKYQSGKFLSSFFGNDNNLDVNSKDFSGKKLSYNMFADTFLFFYLNEFNKNISPEYKKIFIGTEAALISGINYALGIKTIPQIAGEYLGFTGAYAIGNFLESYNQTPNTTIEDPFLLSHKLFATDSIASHLSSNIPNKSFLGSFFNRLADTLIFNESYKFVINSTCYASIVILSFFTASSILKADNKINVIKAKAAEILIGATIIPIAKLGVYISFEGYNKISHLLGNTEINDNLSDS